MRGLERHAVEATHRPPQRRPGTKCPPVGPGPARWRPGRSARRERCPLNRDAYEVTPCGVTLPADRYIRPMGDPLLGPVHELGDRPAVRVGDRALTYGELREAAAAVAQRLQGAQRAAGWAESSLETCVAGVRALPPGRPLRAAHPQLGRAELRPTPPDSQPA